MIVYGYPPPAACGRRMVLPKISMNELNEKLSIISRVVVHPKYRTMGLGVKLHHVGSAIGPLVLALISERKGRLSICSFSVRLALVCPWT